MPGLILELATSGKEEMNGMERHHGSGDKAKTSFMSSSPVPRKQSDCKTLKYQVGSTLKSLRGFLEFNSTSEANFLWMNHSAHVITENRS